LKAIDEHLRIINYLMIILYGLLITGSLSGWFIELARL